HDDPDRGGSRTLVAAQPGRGRGVVPRGHAVLAAVRVAARRRGLRLDVRGAVHRGGAAQPRRPGGVARAVLRARERLALLAGRTLRGGTRLARRALVRTATTRNDLPA